MSNNQRRSSVRRWLGAALLGLLLLLFVLLLSPVGAENDRGVWQAQLRSMPRSLTYTFSMPEYQIITGDDGFTSIEMEGFYPSGLPGDPELPVALYRIALPPLVPLDSVSLEINAADQMELSGSYRIAPISPFLPASDGLPPGADWGPNAAVIVDGKNSLIYDDDAHYRAEPVELASTAHMRKWRIAKLYYWPVSYNPVTSQLRLTTKVTVTLKYDAPIVSGESWAEVQDTLVDDRAEEILLNFDEAQPWYRSMLADRLGAEDVQPGYAIITTNQIAGASSALGDFASHKQAQGYAVQIVTEDEYGSTPGSRADKVREWLEAHYRDDRDNILYALLIGNPDPLDGDMPMKIVDDVPTDFYFADLYATAPGMDWEAEVYVGRIPVYRSDDNWAGILDSILQKTIDYDTSSDLAWRRSALLPMAFIGLGYDGAELGELMKTEYLDDAGFNTYRMYWHGALSNSQYFSEGELVDGAVHDLWESQPFGIVTLYAHGYPPSMSIYDEYSDRIFGLGDVLGYSEVQGLDNSRPALTFQASCSTGHPEEPNNLGYALLKSGAVGTVSGSRLTYGWPGAQPGSDAHNVSLAYNYGKYLTENQPAGQALYWVKSNPGGYISNALAYNLYGDPSVQLLGGPLNGGAELAEVTAGQAETSGPDKTSAAAVREEPAPGSLLSREDTGYFKAFAQLSDRELDSSLKAKYPGWFSVNDPERLLSMGNVQGCGVRPGGQVDCWGDHWGWTDHWKHAEDQAGPYAQVSAGLYHTCGVTPDGRVHCWGRDDYDLGVDQSGPYVQISTNYLHICGLTVDGRVHCWGNNDAGQADDPDNSFVQISAGMQHTCGLDAYGEVDCWGRNAFGQANDRTGPFVQIDAGYFHTCGLKRDGSIDCWGSNHHGQATDRVGPFTQVSTGFSNTCGLKYDGSVECWGKSSEGHAGPFVRISAFNNNCGLKADGDVACWGGWMGEQPGPFGQYTQPSKRMSYTAQQFAVGEWYTAVYLADMDGDDDLELLIGNRDTNSLEIWRYDPSSETLVKIDSIEFLYHIHDIKAADFDEDGDIDVVVGLRNFGLHYAANTGEPGTVGSWNIQPLDESYTWQVLVADFDKDDKLDIFHGVNYGPIKTYYGDGAGGFELGKPVLDPETDMRFAGGFNPIDLNDDGLLDLIGTDGSYMRAFLNPGDRSADWASVGQGTPVGSYPCCDTLALQSNLSPSAGDLDGDGAVDQVAFLGTPGLAGPVDLLIFSGNKYDDSLYWDTMVLDSILYPGYAGHAGVADLDGDGNLDIHVGGWSQFDNLHLYFGDGRGGFTPETILLDHGVGEFNSIAAGDVNGDRVMDFVTNLYHSNDGGASGFEVLYGTRQPKVWYLPFTLSGSPQ